MISLYNDIKAKKDISFIQDNILVRQVLKFLLKHKFILDINIIKNNKTNKKSERLMIILNYMKKKTENNQIIKKSYIKKLKCYSRPSYRHYVTVKQIKKLPNRGVRIYLILTHKGILDDMEAIDQNIGGELLISFN